ncbi:hypothetical protein F4819DRAFT_403745 [Hypoxylon fuscum]|nr:hypothetical protein F4819DRAFT_403745 [Hypoxylon fuscum]
MAVPDILWDIRGALLIIFTVIMTFIVVMYCATRFRTCPWTTSRIDQWDDLNIGLAVIVGLGGCFFAIGEGVCEVIRDTTLSLELAQQAQGFLLWGSVLGKISIILSLWSFLPKHWKYVVCCQIPLFILGGVFDFIALMQCSITSSDDLQHGAAVQECWSQGFHRQIDYGQRVLDVICPLTLVFLAVMMRRGALMPRRTRSGAHLYLLIVTVLIAFVSVMKTFNYSFIRSYGDVDSSTNITLLAVLEYTNGTIAANFIPLSRCTRDIPPIPRRINQNANPPDYETATRPIPLQDLSLPPASLHRITAREYPRSVSWADDPRRGNALDLEQGLGSPGKIGQAT